MPDANVVKGLRLKYSALVDVLDERGRRRWAATEAMALGRGGIRMSRLMTEFAVGAPDESG